MVGTGRLVGASIYVAVLAFALASTGAPQQVLWSLVALHVAINVVLGGAAIRSLR